jgi:hypothetical protein
MAIKVEKNKVCSLIRWGQTHRLRSSSATSTVKDTLFGLLRKMTPGTSDKLMQELEFRLDVCRTTNLFHMEYL